MISLSDVQVGGQFFIFRSAGASCIKDCAAFIPEDYVRPKLEKYLRTEIFTCIKPVIRQVLRTFPLYITIKVKLSAHE